MRAPCKDCPRREVGCHSKCDDYIKFDAENKARLASMAGKSDLDTYRIDMVRTYRKKRRRFRKIYAND